MSDKEYDPAAPTIEDEFAKIAKGVPDQAWARLAKVRALSELNKRIEEVIRFEVAEAMRKGLSPTRTFHRCKNGRVRPYGMLLCSTCRGFESPNDFDAVQCCEDSNNAVAAEREACAAVCEAQAKAIKSVDQFRRNYGGIELRKAADAIRARKETA